MTTTQSNGEDSAKFKPLRVLIACEESGTVCKEFRELGHKAYSCDILPTSGNLPQYHIQGDVLDYIDLNPWNEFRGWDLMIAHPPCTYLCRNASKWNTARNRNQKTVEGNDFFQKLWSSPIPLICIENPVPSRASNLPKYTQIIQPWQFGHDYSKKTCLWLKGLSKLMPTKVVKITYYTTPKGRKFTYGWYKTPRTSIARSKTFVGIAKAMALQWGGDCNVAK